MEKFLDVVYQSTEECMCACPFCGGTASLGFNDVKGLWICFKCGEKGSAKTLVEKLDGTYTEPEVELAYLSDELRLLELDVQQGQTSLPESYLLRFHQPGRIHESWRARGFDAGVCDRWELGYDFLTDRLSIPFRDPFTGRLDGIVFRALGGDGPRYQYPKGFARRTSLYGSWFVPGSSSRDVVLGEGPTDAVSIGRAAELSLSQYGSSLAEGQVVLLHRLGVSSAILFYDYDRAGIAATRKTSEQVSDISLEKVVWDREKYCWHRKVCGCPGKQHQTDRMGFCPRKRRCSCGRIHEPDPGSLKPKEIDQMLGRTARA